MHAQLSVHVEMVIAGTLDSFNKTAFALRLGAHLDTPVDRIRLNVSAASVAVSAFIATSSLSVAQQVEHTLLGSNATVLSAALGGEFTIESVAPPAIVFQAKWSDSEESSWMPPPAAPQIMDPTVGISPPWPSPPPVASQPTATAPPPAVQAPTLSVDGRSDSLSDAQNRKSSGTVYSYVIGTVITLVLGATLCCLVASRRRQARSCTRTSSFVHIEHTHPNCASDKAVSNASAIGVETREEEQSASPSASNVHLGGLQPCSIARAHVIAAREQNARRMNTAQASVTPSLALRSCATASHRYRPPRNRQALASLPTASADGIALDLDPITNALHEKALTGAPSKWPMGVEGKLDLRSSRAHQHLERVRRARQSQHTSVEQRELYDRQHRWLDKATTYGVNYDTLPHVASETTSAHTLQDWLAREMNRFNQD